METKRKKQAEIDGNIFLFGKRFVLRGASALLGQLSHGNVWLHLFSSALDFYISWKKKKTLKFGKIANKHTFLLLQCIWLHFLGSLEHQQSCPTVPEAPKYKKGDWRSRTKYQTQRWGRKHTMTWSLTTLPWPPRTFWRRNQHLKWEIRS